MVVWRKKKVSNILTTIDSVKNLSSFSVGRKILQGKLLAKIKGNVELESKSEWLTILAQYHLMK